jgi:uncharacterized membrane protein YjgN (DUF898 family)
MDINPWQNESARVRFTGENASFRRIVLRGALLELVTFGFYRFWLATEMRQYLWSSTEIDGDALEYTGRGKELLLGFLVAMAILAPLFIVYFLLGLAFERVKAFASLPLYLFLYAFGQFAVYRARRYRLTRTTWRGIRFWMTGSGWSYAWRALLWTLLLLPTLGCAYPWRAAALERYKLGHTYYGDLAARFEGKGGQLFRRVWWVLLLGLFALLSIIVVPIVAVTLKKHGVPTPPLLWLMVPVGLVALPFLHATRVAAEWQWWVEGIRFGRLGVACNLSRKRLFGVYWAMIGIMVLVWLAFTVAFAILIVALYLGPLHGVPPKLYLAHLPVWFLVLVPVWYVTFLLAQGAVLRIYALQRVWRRVADACSLLNIAAVQDVAAAGEAASALGEGLVDGLDFAGF